MIRKRRWEDSKHVAIDVFQGPCKSIIFWTDKHSKVILWGQRFVVFISPWSDQRVYKSIISLQTAGSTYSPWPDQQSNGISSIWSPHLPGQQERQFARGRGQGSWQQWQALLTMLAASRRLTQILYHDLCHMAKIWVRCLESLARPLKTRKGHFDLMYQHCICYHGTIYCPFKVLASKISVRLSSVKKTPIGSFRKLFVVSVRDFCYKKILMNKNIFCTEMKSIIIDR